MNNNVKRSGAPACLYSPQAATLGHQAGGLLPPRRPLSQVPRVELGSKPSCSGSRVLPGLCPTSRNLENTYSVPEEVETAPHPDYTAGSGLPHVNEFGF